MNQKIFNKCKFTLLKKKKNLKSVGLNLSQPGKACLFLWTLGGFLWEDRETLLQPLPDGSPARAAQTDYQIIIYLFLILFFTKSILIQTV